MNKTDLIKEIAKQSKLSQKDCLTTLNAFVETVTKTLRSGDNVTLLGFGKFEVRNRKARNSINPKTLEPLKIPASRVPVFRVSKTFKQAIK